MVIECGFNAIVWDLPGLCLRLHNCRTSPFWMGKLTISMAMFNSYVKLLATSLWKYMNYGDLNMKYGDFGKNKGFHPAKMVTERWKIWIEATKRCKEVGLKQQTWVIWRWLYDEILGDSSKQAIIPRYGNWTKNINGGMVWWDTVLVGNFTGNQRQTGRQPVIKWRSNWLLAAGGKWVSIDGSAAYQSY